MQNSGPWDPWLPVVENSRLFAQPAHSTRCAPKMHEICKRWSLPCTHAPIVRQRHSHSGTHTMNATNRDLVKAA